jgi:hypothetical protein
LADVADRRVMGMATAECARYLHADLDAVISSLHELTDRVIDPAGAGQ